MLFTTQGRDLSPEPLERASSGCKTGIAQNSYASCTQVPPGNIFSGMFQVGHPSWPTLGCTWLKADPDVQLAKAAKRHLAKIHGLRSRLGATSFAHKFLLPKCDSLMRPCACSSHTFMTLRAGRRCKAARSQVCQAQAAVPGPSSAHRGPVPAVCSTVLGSASPVPQRSIIHIISFIPPSYSSFVFIFLKGHSIFLYLREAELLLPF